MSVGVNTTSAGAKTGTVTLAYQTDGTGNGNSGLAAIAAGSQTVNVSGNVYRLATANDDADAGGVGQPACWGERQPGVDGCEHLSDGRLQRIAGRGVRCEHGHGDEQRR